MGVRRAVPYIHCHPSTGHLNYRRRIPAKLKPFIPGKPGEFVRTLGAHVFTAPGAAERFKAADHEYNVMIAKARKASVAGGTVTTFDNLTPHIIDFLSKYYLSTELASDEQLRWGRPAPKAQYASRRDPEQDYEDSREMLASYDGKALRDLWGEWAVQYAADMGYTINPADAAFDSLISAIASAGCELWMAIGKRMDGDGADTPPMPEPPQVADSAGDGFADTRNSFEAIALGIIDSARQSISASTRESSATALRFFKEAHGVPTPAKITRAMVADWLDLLAQRPSRLPQDQRALPLRAVIDLYAGRKDVPRLTPKTFEGHASTLASLWNKARKLGQINRERHNPFTEHRIKRAVVVPEEAKGFSNDELAAMFALPIFTQGERPRGGKGHASYWMPLIMLWTGARPEEVAQLMVHDFQPIAGGGWSMNYTDLGIHPHKGQRSLKTTGRRTGRRTIPVPQKLLDLSLIAYVQHLKDNKETALFPLLRTKSARKLLATGWDDWWGKLMYSQGILSKAGEGRQPAREFRHTFATAARASEIPREVLKYTQGHKEQGNATSEGYGDLAPLGRQLAKLSYEGLDLSAVRPWEA